MSYVINSVRSLADGKIGVAVSFSSGKAGLIEFSSDASDIDIIAELDTIDSTEAKLSDPQSRISSEVRALVGYKG